MEIRVKTDSTASRFEIASLLVEIIIVRLPAGSLCLKGVPFAINISQRRVNMDRLFTIIPIEA